MREDMLFKFPDGNFIWVDARDIPLIPCKNEVVNWDGTQYNVAHIEHVYTDNEFRHTIINLTK